MPARLYQYRLPSRSPFCPVREGLVLEWNGGWGEIAPLPGFSQETLGEAKEETLRLLPHLGMVETRLPSVQWGVEQASSPFCLEPLSVPLCSLNEPRTATLKLKVGHLSVKEAVAYVKQYVGRFRLRIDGNRRWSLDEALFFADHFSPPDFEYLEEPVQGVTDLALFAKETGFPLALDESFREEGWQEISTVKAVVIKPMLSGGIPPLPEGVQLVLSSSYESSLGIVQIARRAPPDTLPLGLDTFVPDLLAPPLRVEEDGCLVWKPNQKEPIVKEKLCLIASVP